MSNERILLIEDDSSLAREIVELFSELGLAVRHIADGEEGLSVALKDEFSLIILDVKLPGKNGFDICRELRNAKPRVPVMFLTTRGSEVDRVLGFELGAIDFVTKPFSPNELLARVRAKLRFLASYSAEAEVTTAAPVEARIEIAGVAVDVERRTVSKNGMPVRLTAKEFDLLLFLMMNPGKVFSKLELLKEVWGLDFEGYEDSVISMIRRIRSKIETNRDDPFFIRTIHGVGYSFVDQGQE